MVIKPSILIVDDEPRILGFLGTRLKSAGYNTLTVSNGLEALAEVRRQEPDLVVMDVFMPEMDGFQALSEMRSFSGVPVIMLTASGVQGSKLRALNLGADDYVTKPFNPDELLARIQAILRRIDRPDHCSADRRLLGDMEINLASGVVSLKGRPVSMARTEWLLLRELAANPGVPVPYRRLIAAVWGHPDGVNGRRLKNWVSRLRMKIDTGNPCSCIRTLRGTAYVLGLPGSGNRASGIC